MIQIYYGGATDKLRAENFHLEKHSDSLKAVDFSRAVQNGQSGCPVGGIWRSPDDFCHGSKHIIDALRNRFVHEKQEALDMLKL